MRGKISVKKVGSEVERRSNAYTERSRRSKVITAAHQPAQMTVEFTRGLYTCIISRIKYLKKEINKKKPA
jgi:hypothetical protein